MFRFIFRTISVFCLAVAVMFVVIDATRSVGVSELVWTPLAESWAQYMPNTLEAFSNWLVQRVHPILNDPILVTLLGWPTSAVFAGLSVLFYLLGHKRRPRPGSMLG